MRRQDSIFWFCFIGTVLLILGVIFLPRYVSRSLDLRLVGRVEVSGSGRDGFSFLEAGSNEIPGVAHAFQYLEKNGENPMLVTSIEEPAQINSVMLDHVCEEVNKAVIEGAIPWIEIEEGYMNEYKERVPVYASWSEHVKYARYYSLTYESEENPNKKEMMNFWYLRFSDDFQFDYYFIVNAVTWQIYYAEIYNAFSEETMQVMDMLSAERNEEVDGLMVSAASEGRYISDFGVGFSDGWSYYYGADGSDYIGQMGQKQLNDKIGVGILYFSEDENPREVRNVYLEIKAGKEPHLGKFRGISIGFQNLSGWVQYLQE